MLALAVVTACGGAKKADDALRDDVSRAASQVRVSAGDAELRTSLAALRADRPESPEGRKARRLAIAGLRATLAARASRRAFTQNDSGNVAAATRDAKRAYRASRRGAALLRAAQRALD